MIGLRPAQMAAAIVHLSPIKLATYIGVGFSNRADGGWFPITFPWGPVRDSSAAADGFKGNISSSIWQVRLPL